MDFSGLLHFLISIGGRSLQCLIILAIGVIIIRLVTFIIHRKIKRKHKLDLSKSFALSCIRFSAYTLAVACSLWPFGITLLDLVPLLTAMGIVLLLGIQNNLLDLVSGIQLIMTKPFIAGDYIKVDEFEGTVINITAFRTCIDDAQMHRILLPNSFVSKNTIINYTKSGQRGAVVNLTIQSKDDLPFAKQCIINICTSHKTVLKDPAPSISAVSSDGPEIIYTLRYFTKPDDYWATFWDINEKIATLAGATEFFEKHRQHNVYVHNKK